MSIKHNDPSIHLTKLRHTTEHILTMAMLRLYGNANVIMAMGPAIEDGFYFDFDSPKNFTLSQDQFDAIEKEMHKIIKADLPMVKKTITVKEARELFKDNPYKQEWLDEIETKGESASVFWTGDEFVDLCAGPHLASTGQVKAFKLLSVAGAYWHGSEKNKMLTRMYGTAFPSQKELQDHLDRLEQAKMRDHRKLGKELDLFTFADEVGPGLPLWKPKGAIIQLELRNWAEATENKWGYVRVRTPHIAKHTLFEISGHLPYYKEDMYSPMEIDGEDYYLKGMNCPHHHMIYKSTPKSYKDLPLRMAEYGEVYRYEQSGSLFGLMRVRFIQQNDAHIYCAESDAEKEFLDVLKLHEYYYNTLGLSRQDYHIVIGLPDESKRNKYHGDKALWDKAEKMMRQSIKDSGITSIDDVGGAAFYGPKIDFNITSSIGREFGISTNQLDLYMPTRFNLTFTNQKGQEELVTVIHRAPLGSHERFIGFLIEHFGGAFPVWLSPVQAVILPISETHTAYTQKVKHELSQNQIRVELWDQDSLPKRIRTAEKQKIPYMLVVGEREVKTDSITIRVRGQKIQHSLTIPEFLETASKKVANRSLDLSLK